MRSQMLGEEFCRELDRLAMDRVAIDARLIDADRGNGTAAFLRAIVEKHVVVDIAGKYRHRRMRNMRRIIIRIAVDRSDAGSL